MVPARAGAVPHRVGPGRAVDGELGVGVDIDVEVDGVGVEGDGELGTLGTDAGWRDRDGDFARRDFPLWKSRGRDGSVVVSRRLSLATSASTPAFSSTSGSPVASALISAKERAWSPMSSTSRSGRSPRVNWAMKADFRSSVCLLRTSLAPRAWNLSGGPIDGVVSAAR